MRKIFCLLLSCWAIAPASAKLPFIEWGAVAGINIPEYSTSADFASVKNKLGWQAGIVTAVKFGSVAVEPQILYVRQGLRIRTEEGGELNLRSNSIDVPVLASLRFLKLFRVYAGPVFTVLNDCKPKSGGSDFDFGRIRPTVSYTAGAGVLLRHILLDLRYNGEFRSKHNVVLPDGSRIDKLRSYNVAFSVGYIF